MSPWMVMIVGAVAHAQAPPCLDAARGELARMWPDAAPVIGAEPEVFATFLGCDAHDLGLRGAFHESLHAVSGRTADDGYALVQPGGEAVVFSPVTSMPASRVATRLSHDERTLFHDTYLTGPQGEQPLSYLFDELNAYVWTLELARRLQEVRPVTGGASSDRDGVAALQWFVVLYLEELERKAPEEHAAVVASPAHRAALAHLFERAGAQLQATCGIPQLGMEDGYWLRRVYGARGGRVLGRFLEAPPSLPEACVALVEDAPKKLRPRDPNAVIEQNVLTRRTVREVWTITVNGEELTLEQLEARAADDPEWQAVLEQVRAQLAEERPPSPRR